MATKKKAATKSTGVKQKKQAPAKKKPSAKKRTTTAVKSSTKSTKSKTGGKGATGDKGVTSDKGTTDDKGVTLDRRSKADRRDQDLGPSAGPDGNPAPERREKVQRRRQIDPTTCERDYSDGEVEFMNALDDYKRTSGRMFPTCSEVLEVIGTLGYVKLTAAELAEYRGEAVPQVSEADHFGTEGQEPQPIDQPVEQPISAAPIEWSGTTDQPGVFGTIG